MTSASYSRVMYFVFTFVMHAYSLLSSLASIKVRGKLGAAFGSYGLGCEAVPMIEDCLLGCQLARHLTGQLGHKTITLDELRSPGFPHA